MHDNLTARAFRAFWRRSDPAYREEPYDPSWSVSASAPTIMERDLPPVGIRLNGVPGHPYTPGCDCHPCKWGPSVE